MNVHKRRLLSAWLGLIAMCLITFMPLASQIAVHHAAQENAALCSAEHHGHQAPMSNDMLAACSYCDLLATHVAMPVLPPRLDAPLVLALVCAVLLLSVCFTPSAAFPSGRPRDPPVLL
jgi:hypothetical protein